MSVWLEDEMVLFRFLKKWFYTLSHLVVRMRRHGLGSVSYCHYGVHLLAEPSPTLCPSACFPATPSAYTSRLLTPIADRCRLLMQPSHPRRRGPSHSVTTLMGHKQLVRGCLGDKCLGRISYFLIGLKPILAHAPCIKVTAVAS